ncbi:MAG: hypothetical protein IJ318_02995 [Clostridia bacterium]|nr:hypothetical protein [Clostridia bacterium]
MSKLKYNLYLNNASKTFSERGFEAILALVLSAGTLALLFLFPVAGLALMAFAYGFLCVGTKSYLLSIAQKQFLPVESIFFKIKICVKAFCLKVATTLITLLWTVVFIIPGIVTALNYSMASFVMADEDSSALECMVKSKKLVYGHRGELLVMYLSYLFVALVIMCVCAGLGCAIKAYFNLPLWVPIVTMCVLALFLLFVFVVPYFELMFAHVYLVLKNEQNSQNKEVKIEEKPKRKYTKRTTAQ